MIALLASRASFNSGSARAGAVPSPLYIRSPDTKVLINTIVQWIRRASSGLIRCDHLMKPRQKQTRRSRPSCGEDLAQKSQESCGIAMNKAWNWGMKRTTNLRLRNYTGWLCDSCAQLITSVNCGWVEWLASEDGTGATIVNGLRLVHRESCRYDARTVFRNNRSVAEGLCLERFMGPDGLVLLLSLLAAGELPTIEVIELAKRVQIPGYELARNLVGGRSLPQLLPYLSHGCYLQSEINEVLMRAMKDQEAA